MRLMEIAFWLALMTLAYVFVGYPLLVWALARVRPQSWAQADLCPPVSIIIAAYNESAIIRERLANCLRLNYPPDKLEIIVASDGSTDDTNQQVQDLAEGRVRLLALPRRRGKLAALNAAVPEARGEILVFTDANSEFQPDAVARLSANFAEAQVGCVAGRKTIRSSGQVRSEEEGWYWRYEDWLKRAESLIHSVVGADGSIYALRRELYPFPAADRGYMDDFVISLMVVQQGARVVYEPNAVIYEAAGNSAQTEFRRKIRTLSGGLAVVKTLWQLLLPTSPIWWQLWSHRVLRFAIPYLLIVVAAASVVLAGTSWFYALAVGTQALLYFAALSAAFGWQSRVGSLAYRLTVMNFVFVPALWRFLSGGTESMWDKMGR
jgi:cellulose synthase/poly-beta-1,6-N-acetylglucosamine synthase-like glycosyltransferase